MLSGKPKENWERKHRQVLLLKYANPVLWNLVKLPENHNC